MVGDGYFFGEKESQSAGSSTRVSVLGIAYHGVSENLTLRHTGLIALLNTMGKSVMATRAQLRRGKKTTLPPKRSILGGRGGIRPQSHALQYKSGNNNT